MWPRQTSPCDEPLIATLLQRLRGRLAPLSRPRTLRRADGRAAAHANGPARRRPRTLPSLRAGDLDRAGDRAQGTRKFRGRLAPLSRPRTFLGTDPPQDLPLSSVNRRSGLPVSTGEGSAQRALVQIRARLRFATGQPATVDAPRRSRMRTASMRFSRTDSTRIE